MKVRALDVLFVLSLLLYLVGAVWYFRAPKGENIFRTALKVIFLPALLAFPVGYLESVRGDASWSKALVDGAKATGAVALMYTVFEPLLGLFRRRRDPLGRLVPSPYAGWPRRSSKQ